jgi:hypothetical protein
MLWQEKKKKKTVNNIKNCALPVQNTIVYSFKGEMYGYEVSMGKLSCGFMLVYVVVHLDI